MVLGRDGGRSEQPAARRPGLGGGALFRDEREVVVQADRQALWQVIVGLGGDNGWYSWRLAWWLRGTLDRFVGGPGLRRGRRHPAALSVGDPLDWWRVERVEEGHLLRLRAEMRVPGLAWLDLVCDTDDRGRTVFRQRALFHPQGLFGYLYWASMLPFHGRVFGQMQRNIARHAEAAAAARTPAGASAGPSARSA